MKKTSILIFAVVLALVMTSCVKDDLFDTPHPTSGSLVVTAEWNARSNNASIPEDYLIRIGSASQLVGGITNTFNRLLLPGKHTMLVFNRPDGISIFGDIATVDGISKASSNIEPMPEFLFAYSSDIMIAADDTIRVTAPMK